jgi:FkbM family methyltransferase
LQRFGYRIADERNIHDEYSLINRLKAAKFHPKTVIDVGVAQGTPYLYNSFLDAQFLLFDPTRESLPFMQEWQNKINAQIFNIGLGSEEAKFKIHTRDTIQHATFLQDTTKPTLDSSYEVEVKRFDSLDIEIARPCIAKIDTEGYEVEVLLGMEGVSSKIDFFIIETSAISLYEGGPSSLDVITQMDSMGFRIIDISGITRRPRDELIHQIDFVFVRKDHELGQGFWR